MRNREREALELTLKGRELARKVGDRDSEGFLESWVRGIRTTLGEWDAVMADDDPPRGRRSERTSFLHASVVPILAARGELEEARRRLEAARQLVDMEEAQNLAGFKAMEAYVLIAEGRSREALAAAEDAISVREDMAGGLATLGVGYVMR